MWARRSGVRKGSLLPPSMKRRTLFASVKTFSSWGQPSAIMMGAMPGIWASQWRRRAQPAKYSCWPGLLLGVPAMRMILAAVESEFAGGVPRGTRLCSWVSSA